MARVFRHYVSMLSLPPPLVVLPPEKWLCFFMVEFFTGKMIIQQNSPPLAIFPSGTVFFVCRFSIYSGFPPGYKVAGKHPIWWNLVLLAHSISVVFLDTTRPRGYKTFSMLNSAEHEFFLLINVKMPTIVGILTFTSKKNSIIGLSEP